MKTQLRVLLSIVLLTCAASGFATTYTVTVANYQFSPATVNAKVGDTVKWVWSNGSHTTTSTSVPTGATTWDSPISSSSTSFSYKITSAGTYSYVCTPHAPDMAGTITATGIATGVSTASSVNTILLYPNPAEGVLRMELGKLSGPVNVMIVDVSGRIAVQQDIEVSGKVASINISSLQAGNYTLRAESAGSTVMSQTFTIVR